MIKIIFFLSLTILARSHYIAPCFEKAREHLCSTKEKIECNGPIGTCKCDDGQTCIWTNMASVQGCPCKQQSKYDYSFIEQAKEYGCNDDKFECKGSFCKCSCVDDSMCLWNGDKNIAGCPCKVKKVWGEPDREMTKEEIKQRRQDREQKRKDKNQDQEQDSTNNQSKTNKKKRVLIEDI